MEVIASNSHSPLGLLSSLGVYLQDWRDIERSISLFCPPGWNVLKRPPQRKRIQTPVSNPLEFPSTLPSKELCLGLDTWMNLPGFIFFLAQENKSHLSNSVVSSEAFQKHRQAMHKLSW